MLTANPKLAALGNGGFPLLAAGAACERRVHRAQCLPGARGLEREGAVDRAARPPTSPLAQANPIIVEDGIGPDGCISPPEVPDIGWETEVA